MTVGDISQSTCSNIYCIYVMLCCVVLCCVVLCCAVLCCAVGVLCCAVLCYVMLCHVMCSCHVMLCSKLLRLEISSATTVLYASAFLLRSMMACAVNLIILRKRPSPSFSCDCTQRQMCKLCIRQMTQQVQTKSKYKRIIIIIHFRDLCSVFLKQN